MKKRFIILENEREYIKKLYGILNEQIYDDPGAPTTSTKKDNKYEYVWSNPKPTPIQSNISKIGIIPFKSDNPRLQNVKFESYFSSLSGIDTLFFVFPGQVGDVGTGLLQYLKDIGVVTAILENFQDLVDLIELCVKNGKKFDKIIVGSHGHVGNLLQPTGENDKTMLFNTSWLLKLKPLLKSSTSEVHFTACYGAEILSVIKDAAEKLGVKAYGGKGIGFYGMAHEEGYYVCEPNPISQNDFKAHYETTKDGKTIEKPESGAYTPINKLGAFGDPYVGNDLKKLKTFDKGSSRLYSDRFLLKYGYCKKTKQTLDFGFIIGKVVLAFREYYKDISSKSERDKSIKRWINYYTK